MDPPKDPPPDLARPGDFVDPSKKPAIPSTENHPFPPSNSGDVSPHPVSPPAGDVVFGARAMDQSTLERDAASKVKFKLVPLDIVP